MKIADSVTDLIGNTPLIKLHFASKLSGANIIAKCEFMNPTSSVKDRIGFNMIQDALNSKKIDETTTIIEPTSGNTGIALASVCAAKKISLVLTMPESMSIERRNILKALGARLVLTPAAKGMNGAIAEAQRLNGEIKNSLILQQFQNMANPQIHMKTTAPEILRDMDSNIDAFVAAVGTGGTLSGTSKVLKQSVKDIKIVAVEPFESAVISGEAPSPHKIQGIGAGFIPQTLNVEIFDEVIKVKSEDALSIAKQIALNEGLLVGISAGANVAAAIELGKRDEFQGKNIVTILCDTAERYMSTALFDVS
ncbi:MAG: cysteine synthase A [Campylobacterota bacterium]|nr:cysteine synthase A [Campylobacterota bacterium]